MPPFSDAIFSPRRRHAAATDAAIFSYAAATFSDDYFTLICRHCRLTPFPAISMPFIIRRHFFIISMISCPASSIITLSPFRRFTLIRHYYAHYAISPFQPLRAITPITPLSSPLLSLSRSPFRYCRRCRVRFQGLRAEAADASFRRAEATTIISHYYFHFAPSPAIDFRCHYALRH
jgi:hypothetical protein